MASLRLDEFSYIRRGRKEHANREAIVPYVSLLAAIGMLTDDLKPYVSARVTLAGFGRSLAEKAMEFAKANGFSIEELDRTIRNQITQKPALLPTPFGVYDYLKPKCSYRSFNRIIRLRCLEDERYGLRVRNRPIVSTRRTIELGGAD
jgi:hypothetical protein